jgi:hypothetical protein
MKRRILFAIGLSAAFFLQVISAKAERVTTGWGGDAEMVYDKGFMHTLMKHPEGGICLFNMELIENDAHGAGSSEKGVFTDVIWGENRARKLVFLDDPRTYKAWLIVHVARKGEYPLQLTVNRATLSLEPWDERKNSENFRWIELPMESLKKGRNTIDIFCPEAAAKEDGWEIYISRADEFEAGGGDPADVGKTSFKSFNGGESWKESPFGPLSQTRAEYSVRLSLDRYVAAGWLATPVIDLWKGDSKDFIVPLEMLRMLRITVISEVSEDAKVEYYMRKGTAPGPFAEDWELYEFLGEGPSLDIELDGADVNRRYIQLRAVLSTKNPLVSPIVKSFSVNAELEEYVPLHRNIHIVYMDNPPIKYSSIPWEWEKWDRPEFAILRKRENLDTVIEGSITQFNAQVKLLDHASKRWLDGGVLPDYPPWDALSILDHIDKNGAGGMCIQNNNYLNGLCMVFGWQARLVNIPSHEVGEVWNDDFGKWIYIDAHRVNHYIYDKETAVPLSVLDLHNRYIDKYFPENPIDWMRNNLNIRSMDDIFTVKRGSLSHFGPVPFNLANMAAHIRMVPRNNWYEKPTPRPLSHGLSQWPWNGYINWYDEQTPPKRQYSWYTDRPRDLWPDLNKVHIDATSSVGNDRLILRFETYTPNFSHFEVDENDTGWKEAGERRAWILQSGRNSLRVRAVNKLGAKGKPSVVVLNHGDAKFNEYMEEW